MMAAEFSSMKKTKSVRPIWAMSKGVIGSVSGHRVASAPRRGNGAPPFPDMRLVLVPEVLQGRQHWRRGGVAEGAQGLAGDVARDAQQQIQIAHLPAATLDLLQDL